MRMPEPGPLGDTLFEARVLAIVAALFVNSPWGGWVESVCTRATHRFRVLGLLVLLRVRELVALAILPSQVEIEMHLVEKK